MQHPGGQPPGGTHLFSGQDCIFYSISLGKSYWPVSRACTALYELGDVGSRGDFKYAQESVFKIFGKFGYLLECGSFFCPQFVECA